MFEYIIENAWIQKKQDKPLYILHIYDEVHNANVDLLFTKEKLEELGKDIRKRMRKYHKV